MRYSDEQFTMIQDCREKKSTAASAYKQRTHCGKGGGVKLPSDFMSKKEIKAMNGECVSYRMNDPITFEVFKTWPEEHQKTYIVQLREKYRVPNTVLAKAMNISEATLRQYTKCLGLNQGKEASGMNRVWHDTVDSVRFWAWWNGEEIPEDTAKPDLRKPMTWAVFKSLDSESRIAYIQWIRDYFIAPDKYISEILFKISPITMRKCFVELGLDSGKGASGRGMRNWNKESFISWCEQNKKEPVIGPVTKVDQVVEPDDIYSDNGFEEHIAECESLINELEDSMSSDEDMPNVGPIAFTGNQIPVIPKAGSMNFEDNNINDILTTLRTLLGGVRVNLTVSWETCIPEEGCICER